MKTLEKKIIKKTYELEARRTILDVINKSVFIGITGIAIILLGQHIYQTYQMQKTLDLLELFSEDTEIVRAYFLEIVKVFYEETPLEAVAVLLIVFILFCVVVLTSIKNFGTIRNRAKSLTKYWFYKNKK